MYTRVLYQFFSFSANQRHKNACKKTNKDKLGFHSLNSLIRQPNFIIYKCTYRLCFFFSRYSLRKIINVEQKPDVVKGDRYLLELELVSTLETRQLVRLSEYVYLRKALGGLCIPQGLQWRRDAIVHLIVTIKNQAKWLYSFIRTVSEAYRKSGDERFKVVVVDFESQDANVEEMLNKSSIRHRYTLVKRAGSHHVTQGLIDAVSTITDPHAIIVLCDIHLDLPPTVMESIRKVGLNCTVRT